MRAVSPKRAKGARAAFMFGGGVIGAVLAVCIVLVASPGVVVSAALGVGLSNVGLFVGGLCGLRYEFGSWR